MKLPRQTNISAKAVAREADELFERGTLEWAAAFASLCEMHRMMAMGRSYLGGRPGERAEIARAIARKAAKTGRSK